MGSHVLYGPIGHTSVVYTSIHLLLSTVYTVVYVPKEYTVTLMLSFIIIMSQMQVLQWHVERL